MAELLQEKPKCQEPFHFMEDPCKSDTVLSYPSLEDLTQRHKAHKSTACTDRRIWGENTGSSISLDLSIKLPCHSCFKKCIHLRQMRRVGSA